MESGGGFPPRAVWDRTLGCVANPPDEEPPPFPNFAWKLWGAFDDHAQRAEDLRIFYVALTRAMDHLIIAGPLVARPRNVSAETLYECFDVENGSCRRHECSAPPIKVTMAGDAIAPQWTHRHTRLVPPLTASDAAASGRISSVR